MRRNPKPRTPRVRVRVSKLDTENPIKIAKLAVSRVSRVRVLNHARDSGSEEERESRVSRVRVRRISGSGSVAETIAFSRVSFFPAMPSVGTRRSTRVFVPKSISKTAAGADLSPERRLRSGKRLKFDSGGAGKLPVAEDEWMRWWKPDGVDSSVVIGGDAVEIASNALATDVLDNSPRNTGTQSKRKFGIVYSRKRRRASTVESDGGRAAGSLRDRMYGIPFIRKQRRKKDLILNNLDENSGQFDRKRLLLVFVESTWSTYRRFRCFLVLLLSWMRRSRLRLTQFTAFLQSDPLAGVFRHHGICFESLLDDGNHETIFSCRGFRGTCAIYGARKFVPLVTLNFAALPSYFVDLNWRLHFRSFYLPESGVRFLLNVLENPGRVGDSFTPLEMDLDREIDALDSVVQAAEFAVQNSVTQQDSKLRKHQKRRSSMRLTRALKNPFLLEHSAVRGSDVSDSSPMKVLETEMSDFTSRDDYLTFTTPGTSVKQKRSARLNSGGKGSELKSFLVDIKQNIDSARCSVNVVINRPDRRWTEDGAEVMLECSGSNEWFLALKIQGSTKYLYKAQEMLTFSRYSHGMKWDSGDGWKLEFCDRKDWLIFRELHGKCCERNAQFAPVRTIPIPVVKEVSDYGDEINVPFVRPDAYISVRDDEVERALMSQTAMYDMDSEDEVCLEQLNGGFAGGVNSDVVGHVSSDVFEKIMFNFEKVSFSHPDDVFDADKAANICVDVSRREIVEALFEHWLRKRKQKQSALVRAFKGPPPKRAQYNPQYILRKKRSFKRQASRVGKSKPEDLLAMPDKETEERMKEAESAAKHAVEIAIKKRRKAQLLMQNADLMTYKALQSIKLAEAIQNAVPAADANPSAVNPLDGEA